jgi:hypothetical protein
MAKHYRWPKAVLGLFAVCLLGDCGAGSATAGPGYLSRVGPVPVRFQTSPAVAPVVLWPPLIQPEKQTVPVDAQMTNAPAAEAPASEAPGVAVPPSATVPDAPAAPPPPQPAMVIPFPLPALSQPDQVTGGVADLQAQINYLLSASTNEQGAKVIMPVFVPPAPPAPFPSSHATYESR